jgi:hypothetical protein
LLHEWTAQVRTLVPEERLTRVRVLALLSLGMIWAGTVRLNQVAATLPLGARVPSTERRLRRFVDNAAVSQATLWWPLLPAMVRRWAGTEVLLVFDPTPYRGSFTVLWVGIVVHRRVLPLTWSIVPQQEPWPDTLAPLLRTLLAPIAAALPPGCQVTLIGDAGLSGPSFLDTVRALGWEVLLRVNVTAGQAHRLRLLDAAGAPGEEQGLWDVVGSVPSGWHRPAQIFKGAGWRRGHLTVCQRPGFTERWVLFSSRPGGRARIREYARRAHRGHLRRWQGPRLGTGAGPHDQSCSPRSPAAGLASGSVVAACPRPPRHPDRPPHPLRPRRPPRPLAGASAVVEPAPRPAPRVFAPAPVSPHPRRLGRPGNPLMANCQGDKG